MRLRPVTFSSAQQSLSDQLWRESTVGVTVVGKNDFLVVLALLNLRDAAADTARGRAGTEEQEEELEVLAPNPDEQDSELKSKAAQVSQLQTLSASIRKQDHLGGDEQPKH